MLRWEACLGLLALAACRGSAVDVELIATPPFTVSRVELEVRDGDAPPAQQTFRADAGLTLPQSLRLLVDGPRLAVSGVAYEPNGEARQASESLEGLRAGGSGKLTLDFSQPRTCPAPPPLPGETVVYDDTFASGWGAFGFGTTAVVSSGVGERCSGAAALRFQVTRPNDGLGFNVAPATGIRSIAFRLHLPRSNLAQLSVAQQRDGKGTTEVVPRPEVCTFNAPGLCDIALVAGWQRVAVEVPASLTGLQSIIFQLRDPFIDPFELVIDDVRIALRP